MKTSLLFGCVGLCGGLGAACNESLGDEGAPGSAKAVLWSEGAESGGYSADGDSASEDTGDSANGGTGHLSGGSVDESGADNSIGGEGGGPGESESGEHGLGGETGAHADSPIVNGSFETGDYDGWVIVEEGAQVYAVEKEGFDLSEPGGEVYDCHGEKYWALGDLCKADPIGKVQVSDGTSAALWIQFEAGVHSIEQTLVVPRDKPILAWDMAYWSPSGSFETVQSLALRILSTNGSVLEVPFVTEFQNTEAPELVTYKVDLSSVLGIKVRIAFVVTAKTDGCFGVNLDHFRFLEQ